MKQAAQYLQHADECRKLAQTARNERERQLLMEMAATWEKLALDRAQQASTDDGTPELP